MKDKNLPPDNNTQSLEELTKEANNIIAVSYTHLTLPTNREV